MKPFTVKRIVELFLEWACDALATGTVSAYRHQLSKFTKHCGRKLVASLAPTDITAWAKSWHEVQSVVRVLNWAKNEAKLLRENPLSELTLPARDERRRVMSPQQMSRMLRACEPNGRAFLLALRETFARPQEIRAAAWEDLQSEDPAVPIEISLPAGKCLIVLREYKDRKRRKESTRPRVLLISRRLGRAILRLFRRRAPSDAQIFLNTLGLPWSNNGIRCLMRRLRERLNIQPDRFGETLVAYSFRHSMATLLSAHGIKDRTLADLLGHIDGRTTARYQHLDVGHLRDAIERAKGQSKRRPGQA